MEGVGDDVVFGSFRLSRRRRSLTSDAGAVTLGGRAFDLLVTLIDRRGGLISKHELLDLVWPGVVVEENNLQVQVATLRRALAPHQSLIQTVPGRGYRFAGEAEHPPAAPALPPWRPDLPNAAARLIGRETEMTELQALLASSRLVTLTGPSGIGKTRLAMALGHAMRPDFAGGVCLIDLAPLSADMQVAGATAAVLGLRPAEDTASEDAIAAALVHRRTLLLFDNCEHRITGVAALIDLLLRRCPEACILATSQEPLRLELEAVYRLDPLGLPPAGSTDIAGFGAIALFLGRVEAADRHFRLTPDNAAAVAEICRSLDGLPLALEMAAARVPMLGIEGLRARLDERLRLLTTGVRTATPRHRTLRAMMAWSYDLLDEADRAVFRRLGIFAGSFSADAVSAVAGASQTQGWEAVDALGRLIDKSLVVAEPNDRPRYRLLETLRLYAIEQLTAHGEREALSARHAGYFDRLLDQAYEVWEETDDSEWLERHAPELDNVRAALDWSAAAPDGGAIALSLAGAGALLWERLSLYAEGRQYLDRAEAALTAETPAAVAARLLRQSGSLWHSADRARALSALERAAALYGGLGDQGGLGAVLALIGTVRSALGATAEANRVLREARRILEPLGRRKSLFNALNNLGVLAAVTGETEAAGELFEQVLVIARQAGSREREALALINLAEMDFCLGRFEQAAERTEGAVVFLRAARQQSDLGWALVNRATYLVMAGDLTAAAPVAGEALHRVRQIGGLILRACLQLWALIAAMTGRAEVAARLAAFVEADYQAAGEQRQPTEQRVWTELRGRLEDVLTQDRLERLRQDAAGWSEQQAAEHAMGLLPLD